MTPRMPSATVTRGLAQKRQARLMRCLHSAGPVMDRPKAARLTRPTWTAAATRAARVLAWLWRRLVHTDKTQAITAVSLMAVPPQARGQGRCDNYPCTPNTLGMEPPPFSNSCKSGDDSERTQGEAKGPKK